MSQDERETVEEIKRIFASLALLAPFSYPILAMPIRMSESLPAPAATNGVTIIINPKLWNKKNFKEKMFIALHEWLHVAFMHCKRLTTKNSVMWNFAADMSINSIIRDDMNDHFEAPCGLYDPVYKNKPADEIYKDLNNEVKLRQEAKVVPKCNCCDRVFHRDDYKNCDWRNPDIKKCPVCLRPTDVDYEEPEYIDREDAINQLMVAEFGAPWGNDIQQMPDGADDQKVLDEVIKAAARYRTGKNPGKLPSFYEDYINEIKKSTVPWYRVLYRFAKESLKGNSDRNPYKPDPKYLPFDVIIPTERGRRLPKLVLIVDTSGSMDTEEFKAAAGHIEKFCTLVDKVTVITADVEVHEVVRIRNIRNALKKREIAFKGRGGTDMHRAFALAEKLKPDLIILFSDMWIGSFPPKPKCNVIFLATESANITSVPYGILLKVDNKI